MTPLEQRISYKFRNPLLLDEALTHPSVGHEAQRNHLDNQRLEFLGDAVLQLVITERLFRHFDEEAEGRLTKLRSRLVSRETLGVYNVATQLTSVPVLFVATLCAQLVFPLYSRLFRDGSSGAGVAPLRRRQLRRAGRRQPVVSRHPGSGPRLAAADRRAGALRARVGRLRARRTRAC